MSTQSWRKRGRHFDRTFKWDDQDGQTAITITALGDLCRSISDPHEARPPVILSTTQVEELLTMAGYTKED